jgi:ATP-dependent Zn protease
MLDKGVVFGVKRQTLGGAVSKFLTSLLSVWLPILPFLFIMKRVVDSSSQKGKRREKSNDPPSTTFADVAGVNVVKEELKEAISCLRDPARFERFNAKMPSGILLYGPPGTGVPPITLSPLHQFANAERCLGQDM